MVTKQPEPKIKTIEEIEGIRKSSVLAANALKFAGEQIKPGMTSNELNDSVHSFILDHNAIPAPLGYLGFPKSTCISINEVVCHGISDETKFEEGDIVKIDIATILNGFFGDNCGTFPVGEISPKAEKLIQVTKKCLEVGINQVKPGAHLNNIGKHIQQYANSKGCSVVYEYAGHGTGLSFHESPNVSHFDTGRRGFTMKEGWVFTIEPMVNLGVPKTLLNESDKWTVTTFDGQLSAQFEHTILVTNSGYEILTIPSK